jgi:hypothetical protein
MINCYIGGCARNCAIFLEKVFMNIIEIGKVFDEYKIVIAYDKSNDGSLDILLKMKEKYSNIEILININQLSNSRTVNISEARNQILQYIANDNNDSYKYFIMMDMDDVCQNLIIQPNVLEKYLIQNNDWDAISFNRDDYYDIWALSIDPYLFSCWHFGKTIESRRDSVNIIKKYVQDLLSHLGKDELLTCHSAFNGFAIYKKDKFINCKYDGNIISSMNLLGSRFIHIQEQSYNKPFHIEISSEDCEHRYFHLQAIEKNHARIRISPLKMFN